MYDMNPIKMIMATARPGGRRRSLRRPGGRGAPRHRGGDSAGVAVGTVSGQATIPYLSHGVGVDESLYAETATPQVESHDTIPYLSHGIGVDESLFAGEQPSIGLTGDSALTRVSTPEPEGLTGDSPLGRGGITSGIGNTTAGASNDDGWTWVGLGSGLAALFAVAFGAMFLSARHRGRVALP